MKPPVNAADQALQTEVAAFFDAFVQAFLSFDGKVIAKRYAAPYLALNGEGALTLLPTQADIASYFQTVLDNYFAEGCRSCRYLELEVLAIGSQSGMSTVTWEMLDQNGKVLSSWRESYNFMRTEDGLRIFASTDHVDGHAASLVHRGQ
ncbi:hypothetical protein [Polaromonas sp. A23]|uniref:hypothetical protein n=1 Tax=Polaromonas sp. A23 TaxID=1944133 RepID=UPI00098538BA|nr:hypothetical protein [Polaromonas sp. A23]OOG44744.1 hypothetical protein B0B52_06460 [Polaromonas sp. A23]